jgi:hypothetical protein
VKVLSSLHRESESLSSDDLDNYWLESLIHCDEFILGRSEADDLHFIHGSHRISDPGANVPNSCRLIGPKRAFY